MTDLEITLLVSRFEFMVSNSEKISLSRVPAIFKEVVGQDLQKGIKSNAKKGNGYLVKVSHLKTTATMMTTSTAAMTMLFSIISQQSAVSSTNLQ